jgi:hypothetical protein
VVHAPCVLVPRGRRAAVWRRVHRCVAGAVCRLRGAP